ncbi:mitochondrial ribonuclease P protein 3 isoform X2 [Zootermopsis nevadensis]|nr:mitochondrial ribonuclease P protein 3 isoform X2 [Zootermopsis nevadensis]XP_021934691.1 mitochondrial ribonuclease P protein 3 isoform X2 [Zootermopsis nevadensis]XP_021934692.1 mitochondrial ribonuclease P protein 3 isoform X2 [Zootermopsis nevadensis]XP_021934693.1 mitochondrial ribonuclease P protein 3 isoform X2 [Zootermopsis nevadensis]XP_021934694.1 mitochondrial ribonuclease P protein 3 isoform X2 [Zootermopsis nevadensis]XP_021934695.1 mitochondrial ribonuclease P protein 3 isofor
MFTMVGHLKYIFSLQKYLHTLAILRPVLHSGGTRICKSKHRIASLFPALRINSLSSQTHSFSPEYPTSDACDPHKSQHKTDSDSDDENTFHDEQDEDILVSVITKGERLSSSEWQAITDQVCAKSRIINCYNIDAVVIEICGRLTQLEMGLSYIEHLSVSGRKLNIATIAQVMKMCYLCRAKGIDEQLVLSMYEDLRSRCPVLDAYTAENAIVGLCLTKHWKLGLDLLDMTKLTCTPGGFAYNALVKTAYDNGELNIGQQLVNELLKLGRHIKPEVFHAQLDYYDRTSANHKLQRWKLVEGFLRVFVENDLKPTVDIAERIRAWYLEAMGPNTEVHAEFTTLTARGICKSCQKNLNPINVTNEEFRALQSAFMDRVVVGGDVFRKTTPEEINEFKNFVKNTAPYDMVIDGLNIAFTGGPKKAQSPQSHARTLHHVVKYFVNKSKKVLVLGRKHMQSWPPRYMDYIYRNSHVFLAQNLSQDDPLLLYAALYSGLGTKFLSKDLMRGHAYCLRSQSLRSTFRRWQLKHQCQLRYISEAGKVHLKFPLTFSPMAQVSSDGSWHIPYETEFNPNPAQSFDAPSTWLCLQADKSKLTLDQV